MDEIRERGSTDDGSRPSLPFLQVARDMPLPDVLNLASKLGRTVDVFRDGHYVVTYCGASPYWWPPGLDGGGMHQISSRGWCHDCFKNSGGSYERDYEEWGDPDAKYVHHLPRNYEVAVLTCEATHDRVLRERVEAEGLTAEEYARLCAASNRSLR